MCELRGFSGGEAAEDGCVGARAVLEAEEIGRCNAGDDADDDDGRERVAPAEVDSFEPVVFEEEEGGGDDDDDMPAAPFTAPVDTDVVKVAAEAAGDASALDELDL